MTSIGHSVRSCGSPMIFVRMKCLMFRRIMHFQPVAEMLMAIP